MHELADISSESTNRLKLVERCNLETAFSQKCAKHTLISYLSFFFFFFTWNPPIVHLSVTAATISVSFEFGIFVREESPTILGQDRTVATKRVGTYCIIYFSIRPFRQVLSYIPFPQREIFVAT